MIKLVIRFVIFSFGMGLFYTSLAANEDILGAKSYGLGGNSIFLNVYNALIAITVSYNYSSINYSILFYIWLAISLIYIFSSLRKLYSIVSNNKFRRKQKKRIS